MWLYNYETWYELFAEPGKILHNVKTGECAIKVVCPADEMPDWEEI